MRFLALRPSCSTASGLTPNLGGGALGRATGFTGYIAPHSGATWASLNLVLAGRLARPVITPIASNGQARHFPHDCFARSDRHGWRALVPRRIPVLCGHEVR